MTAIQSSDLKLNHSGVTVALQFGRSFFSSHQAIPGQASGGADDTSARKQSQ